MHRSTIKPFMRLCGNGNYVQKLCARRAVSACPECWAKLCSRTNHVPGEFFMDTGHYEDFSTRYYPSETNRTRPSRNLTIGESVPLLFSSSTDVLSDLQTRHSFGMTHTLNLLGQLPGIRSGTHSAQLSTSCTTSIHTILLATLLHHYTDSRCLLAANAKSQWMQL